MKQQSLIFLACLALGCGPREADRLLFISLDTVRRDHLPTYGYDRDTAPEIDDLARMAIVFEDAFAQHTNTNPSHASIFTGLYPHSHGIQFNGQILPTGQVTLAQILGESGFRTAAFVSGLPMQAAVSGFQRGFELYDDAFEGKRREGKIATSAALSWIRARTPDESYFAFVHLYDAHGPYRPAGRYAGLYHSIDSGPELPRIPRYQAAVEEDGSPVTHLHPYVDRYDALIRYQDDLVGALLKEIDPSRTVVVVLSDHGETLGERYQALDHGGQAFDEQIRIPLIVRAPGFAPRHVRGYVETVDLLPTLLELLDVELPSGTSLQGKSLVPSMKGEPAPARPFVFSSARSVSARHADRGYELRPLDQIHTVRGQPWKLILYPGHEGYYAELYDLAEDAAEREDQSGFKPFLLDAYVRVLEGWLRTGNAYGKKQSLSPETLEKLRELGYVD